MRVYWSGGFPYYTPEEITNFYHLGVRRRLFSYHFIDTDKSIKEGFEFIKKEKLGYEIMVDSGAFSVSMKGATVDIDKYAELLLQNRNMISLCLRARTC